MNTNETNITVGVVALQGDFEAHVSLLMQMGVAARAVRTPDEVRVCDGLILPGGESTTIGRLLARYGLDTAIRAAHAEGTPIYGTCAGMILLARGIVSGEKQGGQPTLGLMDVMVARNAFGRQIDSFEVTLDAPDFVGAKPLSAIFIRAPYIADAGPDVTVLARYDGKIVLAQQGNLLASAFHPEITGETRVHEYFLRLVREHAAHR